MRKRFLHLFRSPITRRVNNMRWVYLAILLLFGMVVGFVVAKIDEPEDPYPDTKIFDAVDLLQNTDTVGDRSIAWGTIVSEWNSLDSAKQEQVAKKLIQMRLTKAEIVPVANRADWVSVEVEVLSPLGVAMDIDLSSHEVSLADNRNIYAKTDSASMSFSSMQSPYTFTYTFSLNNFLQNEIDALIAGNYILTGSSTLRGDDSINFHWEIDGVPVATP